MHVLRHYAYTIDAGRVVYHSMTTYETHAEAMDAADARCQELDHDRMKVRIDPVEVDAGTGRRAFKEQV